jgi:V8-like Glu-specific endopeptidase
VVTLGSPVVIGPATGAPTTPPNIWAYAFPVDPAAKHVMLHFNGAALGAGDHIEVDLGYDTDRYDSSWGPDYWSRPIRGDAPVNIRYVRGGGAGSASVTLDQYMRGEALIGDGSAKANGDMFLIDSPFAATTYQYAEGKYPPGSAPDWENIACPLPAVMVDTARSVGMYVHRDKENISSCTCTLIAPDLVITAGHCMAIDADARTGSVTFDFQTNCDGTRPAGYNPRFYKLKRVVRSGYARAAGDLRPQLDYCILQFVPPPGGIGLPPIPIRNDLPPVDEPLFIIHHPRGQPKKVSRYPIDATCKVLPSSNASKINFGCDIDNGSSGSSIFDSSGRIVANLSFWDGGTSVLAVSNELATEPPPPKAVDVVVVLDRSGSMALPSFNSPNTKMQDAQAAAALFISLLRTGAGHRVGLVSFSTAAAADFALAAVDAATKNSLVGPVPPATAGLVGGLGAGGMTTIGGGLQTAAGTFPMPGPQTNSRAVVLMTDGLENTPPMIAMAEQALANTVLNIVGFGTEANLDGPRLTQLARDHGGIYTRANEGLSLKKFFALAFGNIFNLPTSLDPDFFLPQDVMAGPDVTFSVCGETNATIVLGWNDPHAALLLTIVAPDGTTITAGTPGVGAASGDSWAHMHFSLPFAGQRDGTWKVRVVRPGGGGEFPPPKPALRYFVSTLVEGGPYLRPAGQPPIYTGDTINPRVILREPSGRHPDAVVTVEIESPLAGTGNILTAEKPGGPGQLDGDQIDSRTNKLMALEAAEGAPLVAVTNRTFPLYDDGAHDDGAIEEDGIYGNPLADLTRFEGHYRFHARAVYGDDCKAAREAQWSVYVSVGIDPANTAVTANPSGVAPDGRQRVTVTFTPRDKYGSYVGPGRGGSFTVGPTPDCALDGDVKDHGDGTYSQTVLCDPNSGMPPGVTVAQPGRPPVTLGAFPLALFSYSVKFVCGRQEECPCGCAPVVPGVYATEINIHNHNGAAAPIIKLFIPLVLGGAVIGREPKTAGRKAFDRIDLPPHSATMDDCCRISELLLGAPAPATSALSIGILEIISLRELSVSAVYTVSNPLSGSVDIDVKQIATRFVPLGTVAAEETRDLRRMFASKSQ